MEQFTETNEIVGLVTGDGSTRVEQFERYRPSKVEYSGDISNIHFPEDARDLYYSDFTANQLIDSKKGQKELSDFIYHFLTIQKPRLWTLKQYSIGNNTNILFNKKSRGSHKPNSKYQHPWGRLIVSTITEHIASNPIKMTYSDDAVFDGDTDDIADIQKINRNNNSESLNLELFFDAGVFGRAYRIIYRKNGIDKFINVSPEEMFAIYKTDIEPEMIMAVHLPIRGGEIRPTVYTDKEIIELKPIPSSNISYDKIRVSSRTEHLYGVPPVVDCFNDRDNLGEMEPVLSLIDGYDRNTSNIADMAEETLYAKLFLSTASDSIGTSAEELAAMERSGIMYIEEGETTNGGQTHSQLRYVEKTLDWPGMLKLGEQLLKDIFRLSNIPDLTGDKFNTTASGIALQIKLIGMTSKARSKFNYYEKALRKQYEIINNLRVELDEEQINVSRINFDYDPAIPTDVWREIEVFVNAGGQLSQQTMRENLTFTTHEQELKRITKERELEGTSPNTKEGTKKVPGSIQGQIRDILV